MSTLKEFLKENPVYELVEKVVISERLKDFEFVIKAIHSKELSDLNNDCTTITADRKIKVDSHRMNQKIITDYCVEPNFKCAEDIADVGCNTPDEYIDKVLTVGEQQNLMSAIYDLSGLNKSFKDLRNEAKN